MGLIRRLAIFLAVLAPGMIAASPATAAAATARHYDCSKAGNANKAACKGTAPVAAAPATPARTTTTKTATTTRQYDCTKAGNANKTACKTAGAQIPSGKSPGAVKTTTVTNSTTTDCTKWYNKMRAACKTTSASSGPKTTVAPAPRPTAAPRSSDGGENSNPNGASAQCRDGTYSHAAHHQGACSRHGGVAKWMN
jgi:hypothetical protein